MEQFNDGSPIFIFSKMKDILDYQFPDETYDIMNNENTGGFNKVQYFLLKNKTDPKIIRKIVYRKSKTPIILLHKYNHLQKYIDVLNNSSIHEKKINETSADTDTDIDKVINYCKKLIANTQDEMMDHLNWVTASNENISPQLEFFGYIMDRKMHTNNDNGSKKIIYAIHKIIISEAYDTDLYSLYKDHTDGGKIKPDETLRDFDRVIAKRIIDIIAKVHNKAHRIPFDIKPDNIVINVTPYYADLDVRMIDLDSNLYHDYSNLLKKTGEHAPKELIKALSIMILANHFFYFFNWNIFQEYIKDNHSWFDEKKASLFALFCEVDIHTNTPTKLSQNYQHMNNKYLNYFITGYRYMENNLSCEKLFNTMFDNMKLLSSPNKYPDFPSINKDCANDGCIIAGGNSRKLKKNKITKHKIKHSCNKTLKKNSSKKGIAVIDQNSYNIEGKIFLKETLTGLKIEYEIKGLENGLHGFHIHEYGDLSDGCNSACSHFNPFNRKHGGLYSRERHAGDLGNIKSKNNLAKGSLYVKGICLTKNMKTSVLGRMFVIHDKEDDLGKGNNDESLKTGNAGKRLACGVIGLQK